MGKNDFIRLIRGSRPFGLMGCAFLLVVLLLFSLSGVFLNREMQKLDWDTPAPASADKIVVYLEDSQEYTTKYLPESLQARKVGEVAAVISCKDGTRKYGFYTGGQTACIHEKHFVWHDLKTGHTLDEEVFSGGIPPFSVDSDAPKLVYGSEPDADEITQWIEQIAQKNLK